MRNMSDCSKEFFPGPAPNHCRFLRDFEEIVQRYPDKIAVSCEGISITYAALNAGANQLGRYLQRKGIGPEKPVVAYLERSIPLAIAFLGILKAGGIYVPFDPPFPPRARLSFMVNDVGASWILTSSSSRAFFTDQPQSILVWEEEWPKIREKKVKTSRKRPPPTISPISCIRRDRPEHPKV